MTFDEIREIALALPEMEESTSYCTPAFKVRKKLIVRLKEDQETLVLKMDDENQREFLLQSNPDTYFMTDHYVGYNYILVRMAKVNPEEISDLIEQAWRIYAPKRAIKTRTQNS